MDGDERRRRLRHGDLGGSGRHIQPDHRHRHVADHRERVVDALDSHEPYAARHDYRDLLRQPDRCSYGKRSHGDRPRGQWDELFRWQLSARSGRLGERGELHGGGYRQRNQRDNRGYRQSDHGIRHLHDYDQRNMYIKLPYRGRNQRHSHHRRISGSQHGNHNAARHFERAVERYDGQRKVRRLQRPRYAGISDRDYDRRLSDPLECLGLRRVELHRSGEHRHAVRRDYRQHASSDQHSVRDGDGCRTYSADDGADSRQRTESYVCRPVDLERKWGALRSRLDGNGDLDHRRHGNDDEALSADRTGRNHKRSMEYFWDWNRSKCSKWIWG